MYVIPPYVPTVTLLGVDGSSRTFESPIAALKSLSFAWIRRNVGPDFTTPNPFACSWDPVLRTHNNPPYAFVLREEFGRVLLPEDFAALLPYSCKYSAAVQLLGRRFRYGGGAGPVPGTGRHHSASLYRRPKTTRDKRAACAAALDELEPPVRAARNVRNLPGTWDDIQFSARYVHNWKRFRKTQYRQKGGAQ